MSALPFQPNTTLRTCGSIWDARNEALDTRFFDFHRDLEPGAIAHLLDGRIVWRDERQGEWAAVLHFNRPQVASLH